MFRHLASMNGALHALSTQAVIALFDEGDSRCASATGRYTLTANIPGQKTPLNDNGKWFVILKRQADGSWKRTADCWNSDNPPPKT